MSCREIACHDDEMLRRFRWAIAQIGRKPGRREALAVLPRAEELAPGSWRTIDERTWRTGSSGTPWGRRARAAGSITAWRSFARADDDAWLWVQATPLASAADASQAVPEVFAHQLANRDAEYELLSEYEVDPPVVPGADGARAREARIAAPSDLDVVRTLVARSKNLVVMVGRSGERAGGPDWNGVTEPAALVIARFAEAAARDPHA